MVGVMHRFAWLAVAALAVAPATPALAHAHLLSSVPAAGSTAMPPPTALRLNFSEGLELKFTKVKLIGPEKNAIGTGSAALDPKDDKVLILPVNSGLADGKYTVEWQAVSTDGHKTTGSYSFSTMK
jgi:methionine-rich copper-binding protein CopC